MRLIVSGFLLVCAVAARGAAAEQKFPYDAVIESDDVYARSGPGRKYYPTSKLKLGDHVRVHRHDPGGWYMIAPPPGSFSWIPAKYVQRVGERRGRIRQNGVVVRVGSFESDIRDVEQRRLNEGDEVVILGEKRLELGNEPQELWYKIEPPRNEWRWVIGQFVVPADKRSQARAQTTDPFDPRYTERRPGELSAPREKSGERSHLAQKPDRFDSDSPAESVYNGTGEGEFNHSTKPGKLIERPLVRKEEKGRKTNDGRPATKAADTSAAAEDVALDALDAQFRAMLTKETSEWDFRELEQAYLKLHDDVSRVALQRIIESRLATIAKYEQERKDYVDLVRLTSETARRDAELAARQRELESQLVRRDRRYDGAGIVQRTNGGSPGAPQFVLLAPGGRVLAYLQAEPGVELGAWVGRSAGISGKRWYQPTLQTDVISVKKLTPVQLSN